MPTPTLHLWLMLTLTFSTGVIDAVGYLGLDRVFTGNMTGNVVILGMALTGTTDLPILGPCVALACFAAGAMAAGRMLRGRPAGWVSATTWILALVGALLGIVVLALLVLPARDRPEVAMATTALLGLVMGMQAAAARHVKVADVTTVVVTSTITGLAADSRLGAATGQDWVRRLLAVVLILLGALVGAALLPLGLWAPILLSATLTCAVTLVGRHRQRALQRVVDEPPPDDGAS